MPAHPSLRRGRFERGLTFIELMVVVTLLGLMATLVVAKLDSITVSARVSGAAREFGNQMTLLRDLAGMQGRELAIEVDLDEQRWRTIDTPSKNEVPDERDREELTDFGSWRYLEDGLKLASLDFGDRDVATGDTLVFTFTAEGELRPAGFVAFFTHEDNEEEDGLSVEVSGLTGLVNYYRGLKLAEEVRGEGDF